MVVSTYQAASGAGAAAMAELETQVQIHPFQIKLNTRNNNCKIFHKIFSMNNL
jgi:aspartate-semialdehyde dehydrogenase